MSYPRGERGISIEMSQRPCERDHLIEERTRGRGWQLSENTGRLERGDQHSEPAGPKLQAEAEGS